LVNIPMAVINSWKVKVLERPLQCTRRVSTATSCKGDLKLTLEGVA
jgi:hypothetical protein